MDEADDSRYSKHISENGVPYVVDSIEAMSDNCYTRARWYLTFDYAVKELRELGIPFKIIGNGVIKLTTTKNGIPLYIGCSNKHPSFKYAYEFKRDQAWTTTGDFMTILAKLEAPNVTNESPTDLQAVQLPLGL